MKIKHLLLGVAIVALMAACGNKASETATETVVEETITEETVAEAQPEEEVAEPVKETAQAPVKKQQTTKQQTVKQETTKQETKQEVDPCEAKVKAFEKYVDQLKAAKKAKGNGAEALKAYVDLKAKATSMEATISDCSSNPDYKTRLQNAIMAEKQAR